MPRIWLERLEFLPWGLVSKRRWPRELATGQQHRWKSLKIFMNTLGKFGLIFVVTSLCVLQTAQAVILFGTGDPNANTSPPTGTLANSGWQYQGTWGGFLGTPIASNYFIAAKHVGNAGNNTFVFNGQSYSVIQEFDHPDPNVDLTIWKVQGSFPTYAH